MKPVSTRVQIAWLAACLLAAGGLWWARDHIGGAIAGLTGAKPSGKQGGRRRGGGKRAVPVIIARAEAASSDERVAAVGTARARRSIMLHAKSDGVIMSLASRPGDRVKAGQTIFALDTTQASLAVRLAEKKLADAQRTLARQQQLSRRGVASKVKVDDSRLAVERAELELHQAQKSLRDLTIAAPFDGVVGMPSVEVGDRVTTATAVVSLDMRRDLLVEFPVPERYATRIRTGHAVTASTPGFDERQFAGRIAYIDSRIDPTSRTAKVRAVFANPKDILRPGMSFAVELLLKGKSYVAVPELSLQWRKGESYVWIVRDKVANKVPVRTIQRQNSRVLIAGEVRDGDLVVVEGVQRLRHGRKVRFDPPAPANQARETRRSARRRPPAGSPTATR